MPWDWDSSFQRATNASLIGSGNLAKTVTSSPDLTRRYHAQLYQLIQTSFNTAYMSRWTQHYGAVAGQDFSSILNYIGARASYVLSQLPTSTGFSTFTGTVTAAGTVPITGTANIAVATIEVNGVRYVPTWSSNTAWRISVPLAPGANTLVIRGLDHQGAAVAGATATVSVTNPNGAPGAGISINEWLAQNDGAFRDAAGESDDWFEIHNPTNAAINLAGYKLTDTPGSTTPFVIPNGWTIPAGGYLLVWADNQPAQNPASPTASSALHVSFKLSSAGDAIELIAPDNRVLDSVRFGPQTSNRSEGRFPDSGSAISALTLPTPGNANVLTRVALPAADGSVTFTTTSRDPLHAPTQRGSFDWENVEPTQTAVGYELRIIDPLPPGAPRFYRVQVGP